MNYIQALAYDEHSTRAKSIPFVNALIDYLYEVNTSQKPQFDRSRIEDAHQLLAAMKSPKDFAYLHNNLQRLSQGGLKKKVKNFVRRYAKLVYRNGYCRANSMTTQQRFLQYTQAA